MKRSISLRLSKRQLWFCLPLLISYAADVTTTLLGQSSGYWAGAYYDVNETNPISHWFLTVHPFAYLSYRVIVFGIIAMLIAILPMKMAELVATAFFLAHTTGVYGWLKDVFYMRYWTRHFLLFLLAVLFTYAYTQAEKPIRKNGKLRRKTLFAQD